MLRKGVYFVECVNDGNCRLYPNARARTNSSQKWHLYCICQFEIAPFEKVKYEDKMIDVMKMLWKFYAYLNRMKGNDVLKSLS